jgi:pyruvate/2-oxoglutarate dehydrogenase complex dihydrolipoamide acyltransferase (E2) component
VQPTAPQAEPQSPSGAGATQEAPTKSPATAQPTASDLNALLTDAVSNMDKKVEELKGIDKDGVKSIRAVNVQTLLTEKNDIETFKKAMTDNQSNMQALQGALNQNTLVKDTLVNNNIPINRVVALNILEGNSLVVFYM